jgi:hypothetical protein
MTSFDKTIKNEHSFHLTKPRNTDEMKIPLYTPAPQHKCLPTFFNNPKKLNLIKLLSKLKSPWQKSQDALLFF